MRFLPWFVLGCTLLTGCNPADQSNAPEQRADVAPPEETCQPGQLLLKINSSYRGRQRIEEALRLLGYDFDASIKEELDDAVKRFQEAHNLPATGKLDDQTSAAALGRFAKADEDFIYLWTTGRLVSYTDSRLVVGLHDQETTAFSVDQYTLYNERNGATALSELPVGACLAIVANPTESTALDVSRSSGGMRITIG